MTFFVNVYGVVYIIWFIIAHVVSKQLTSGHHYLGIVDDTAFSYILYYTICIVMLSTEQLSGQNCLANVT